MRDPDRKKHLPSLYLPRNGQERGSFPVTGAPYALEPGEVLYTVHMLSLPIGGLFDQYAIVCERKFSPCKAYAHLTLYSAVDATFDAQFGTRFRRPVSH